MGAAPSPGRLRLAVGLLSAGVLAYETLLLKLLPLKLWAPAAGAVISLALLGFGAAGAVVTTVSPEALPPRRAFPGLAGAFGIGAPAAFALAEAVPLNPLELLWSPAPWLGLGAVYLALGAPFFLAGLALALAYRHQAARPGPLYAADLAGAAAGASLAVAVVHLGPPSWGLRLVCLVGALSAASLLRPRAAAAVGLAGLLLGTAWPDRLLEPRLSPYKPLARMLATPGTRVEVDAWTPWGRLTVARSAGVPFRHAPGLSLACPHDPPPARAAFLDGDLLDALPPGDAPWDYLECLPWSLPYRLWKPQTVLVLEAGLGFRAEGALRLGARRVVAVEPIRVPTRPAARGRPGIVWAHEPPRLAVARTRKRYDLVDLAAPGPYRQVGAAPDLLTAEGLYACLRRLGPGGVLSIAAGAEVPPRTSLQVVTTAAEALRRLGLDDPGRAIAWVRSWGATQVLVRPRGFSPEDLARLRELCDALAFDLAWIPGMAPSEANRHHWLDRPWFFEAARAALGPDRTALRRYPFRTTPATDLRPALGRTLRWTRLPEWIRNRRLGTSGFAEEAPLLQAGVLAVATLAGSALILWPLRRLEARLPVRPALYFAGLGFGFMGCEVTLVETLGRLVGHPAAGAGLALAGILVAAGAGAASARTTAPAAAAGAAAGAATLLALGFGPLLGAAGGAAAPARLGVATALVAATGFVLGRPFPAGLARVGARAPRLVPWAWGVNGFASVAGAALAGLVVPEAGYAWTLGLSAAAYAVAALADPEPRG
ncbi:polyamine aminopropyltransferase [Deferrisoma palaeochoriense]